MPLASEFTGRCAALSRSSRRAQSQLHRMKLPVQCASPIAPYEFSFREKTVTPLLLARDAIMVAIHLDIRAIPQEVGSLRARSHLRAMGPTVAMETCRGILIGCMTTAWRLGRNTAGIFAVAVSCQSKYKNEREDTPEEAGFLSPMTGLMWPATTDGSAIWKRNALCSLPSVLINIDFKGETFADPRSLTILWKGGDMDEYLRATLRGCDESEAPIISPFRESPFDAHSKGLTCYRGKKGQVNSICDCRISWRSAVSDCIWVQYSKTMSSACRTSLLTVMNWGARARSAHYGCRREDKRKDAGFESFLPVPRNSRRPRKASGDVGTDDLVCDRSYRSEMASNR